MDTKNYTQVLIDGKIYTLGGSEDEAYLQKAASYVNDKLAQMRRLPGFSKQNADYQSVMTELNIADDYFKAMEWAGGMERQRNDMEKETYSLKHELVSTQMKLEAVLKDLEERQREFDRLTKAMARKEGELTEARSGNEARKDDGRGNEALGDSGSSSLGDAIGGEESREDGRAVEEALKKASAQSGQTVTGGVSRLRVLKDVETVTEVEITEEAEAGGKNAAKTVSGSDTAVAAAGVHTAGLSDEELAKRALKAAKKARPHRGGRR